MFNTSVRYSSAPKMSALMVLVSSSIKDVMALEIAPGVKMKLDVVSIKLQNQSKCFSQTFVLWILYKYTLKHRFPPPFYLTTSHKFITNTLVFVDT